MNETGVKEHKLFIAGRKSAQISGVNDVKCFDSVQVVLSTEQGGLLIKGDNLHVGKISLEKGEIDIDGRIDSFTYTNKGMDKDNLLKRLFK